jgi:ubiquinone/menaquinone biosynthesis C-methylase UbiE
VNDPTVDDLKSLSQQRFGKYAASYVSSWSHRQGPDLQRLVELAGDHPGWEALDIATGGGHTALAIAPHVARVVATDLTEPMLAAAREFILAGGATNVEFHPADAEDLPFTAASFDLVTCRIAAHHFPHPERFVAEVVRVLRPGGLFLLQDQVTPEDPKTADWITAFEKRRDPSHGRALSRSEWLALVAASGLSVETEDRFQKRVGLLWWVGAQEGSAEDLAELRARLHQAPSGVQAWMHPADLDTDQAAFTIVHYVFSARKTGLGDLGAGC